MRPIFLLLVVWLTGSGISTGQLVTKKDFDAAFALQLGVGVGTAFPHSKGVKAGMAGGLKMTFPITRQWFLGAEVNYNEFGTENQLQLAVPEGADPVEALFRQRIRSVQVPVYARVMLINNKTSLLFGGYYAHHADSKIERKYDDRFRTELYEPTGWSAGAVVGVEQIVSRNLYLTFKLTGSVVDIAPKGYFDSGLYPLQATLSISYDLLRIGDCGCY